MYLKLTIDGDLEQIVKSIWPNSSDEEILFDYENVYEWVWLTLPNYDLRLNVSREHEWGEEEKTYPIYVSAFELSQDKHIDQIPQSVIEKFKSSGCKIEVFEGRFNVEVSDGTPIQVL